MKAADMRGASAPVHSMCSSDTGPWVGRQAIGTEQPAGEQIRFTRPAITTGACLPWNMPVNKASFWPPRAFTSQQSKPAITILSNNQEATKLVYSKREAENYSEPPIETPFSQQSQICMSDEEQQRNETLRNPFLPEAESRSAHQDPDGGDVENKLEYSSGKALHRSSQVSRQIDAQEESTQVTPLINNCLNEAIDVASMPCETGSFAASTSTIWLPLRDDTPKRSNLFQTSDDHHKESTQLTDLGGCASFVAESTQAASNATPLQRSSRSSSPLKLPDYSVPVQGMARPFHKYVVDNCSQRQHMDQLKRKVDESEAGCEVPVTEEKPIYQDGPTAKRRPASRMPPATKAADKKTQEIQTMEKMIQKLQSERLELHARWKRQLKACNELKSNLAEAEDKLKVQEEINAKMKAEMHYLRNSLAIATEYSAGATQPVMNPYSRVSPMDLPWSEDCSMPISIPTQEDMAAELNVDCTMVPAPSQDCALIPASSQLIPEWQIW